MHYYANGHWFQDPYEAIWYKKNSTLAQASGLRSNPEEERPHQQRSAERRKLLKKRMARRETLEKRIPTPWEPSENEPEEILQTRIDDFYRLGGAIRSGIPLEMTVDKLYQENKSWAEVGEPEEKTKSRLTSSFRDLSRLKGKRSQLPSRGLLDLQPEEVTEPSKYQIEVSPHLYNIWTFGSYLLHPFVKTKRVGNIVKPVHIGSDDLQWCLQKANDLTTSSGKKHFVMPQEVGQRAFNLWIKIGNTLMPCLYVLKEKLVHLGSSTLEQAERLKEIILRDRPDISAVWVFPKDQSYGPEGELLTAYSPGVW